MTFDRPELLLWLAACLPLVLGSFWAAGWARARRARLLGDMAGALAPGFSRSRRMLRDALGIGAVALCITALAGPEVGTWMREIQQRGVDVMIVLDSSRSMLARDIGRSRLDRAKREVQGMLTHLSGDRVGLVAFAGDAKRICPLTHDPSSFRLFLADVDTYTCALGGTAIGEGLALALDAFDPDFPAQRVIVLLTDGEDHMSDPPATEVAYRARAMNIPVHVIAFGSQDGGEIPVRDERGRFDVLRDKDGIPVISRPDEALLERIASISDGAFLSADDVPFPLDEIWTNRVAVMEGVTRASSTREEGVNRFQWALALALLCLGTRQVLAEERGP